MEEFEIQSELLKNTTKESLIKALALVKSGGDISGVLNDDISIDIAEQLADEAISDCQWNMDSKLG